MESIYSSVKKAFVEVGKNKIDGKRISFTDPVHIEIVQIINKKADKEERVKKKYKEAPVKIKYSGVLVAECGACGNSAESHESSEEAEGMITSYDEELGVHFCDKCKNLVEF